MKLGVNPLRISPGCSPTGGLNEFRFSCGVSASEHRRGADSPTGILSVFHYYTNHTQWDSRSGGEILIPVLSSRTTEFPAIYDRYLGDMAAQK